VVIVVIATVAAIAVPRMSRAAAGARESACRAGLRTYLQALELYQGEHGTYPSGITPSILSTRELIPNPFGGSLTNPILRDSSGDASLQHPMTKRFRADNPAAKTWWYNPANGAFRALVPQTGDAAWDAALYESLNGTPPVEGVPADIGATELGEAAAMELN